MKKLILIITVFFAFNVSFGQNFKELLNYKFETVESYKSGEDKVLTYSNYLFNNPANQAELNRLTSIQFIMNWMEGTPDYTFEIGEQSLELTKGNSDLLGLYFAAMSKVVIENKGEKLDSNEIYTRAEKILVDYCSNPDNKMKPSKKIKKIIKSRNKE